MSSTNKTANYELSQFVGTDIPSILSDYNGDMRKIDAGIAEVATSAGSSASAISALAGRVTTAENSITTLNGALEVTNQRSIQNQTAITGVQGVIPSDASTENKLATVEEVGDVADNVRGVDDRVQAIEAVVPSTASSSNKLATMADLGSAGGDRGRRVNIPYEANSTLSGIISLVKTKIQEIGGGIGLDPFVTTMSLVIDGVSGIPRGMCLKGTSAGSFIGTLVTSSQVYNMYIDYANISEAYLATQTTSGMTITDILNNTATNAGNATLYYFTDDKLGVD